MMINALFLWQSFDFSLKRKYNFRTWWQYLEKYIQYTTKEQNAWYQFPILHEFSLPSLKPRDMFIKHSFFSRIEKIDVLEICFFSPPETTSGLLCMLSSQNHVPESMKLPYSFFFCCLTLLFPFFLFCPSESQESVDSSATKLTVFLSSTLYFYLSSFYTVFTGALCKPQHLHELEKGLCSCCLLPKKTKLTLLLWLTQCFCLSITHYI